MNFYYNEINKNQSNIELYNAFDISNLSNFIARLIGKQAIIFLITILMILLICQMLLFIIFVLRQPPHVKEYFDNPEKNAPVTFVDKLSNEFAIPLGFLGTVVSIWVSLEEGYIDYSSFFQILEIIKLAIFTTVLGLSIKILCIIRGALKTLPESK